jgi:uncharacterized protein YbjT (DUF2867 family)
MAAGKPVILVTGATGAQGGGVARRLLAGGQFAVRVLTRKLNSPAATALREAGAEVVGGDFDEPARLNAAMKGCYGVFGVTNFWEHFDGEYRQGRNLVDAVAASGIRHFVFSTLPYIDKITGGQIKVPHFDNKGRMEEYARQQGVAATFVHCAFYYQNFLSFFPPRLQEDGLWAVGMPQGSAPMAAVNIEDLGGVAAAVFGHPGEFLGRVLGVAGDFLTGDEYAATMSRVLGRKIVYQAVRHDVFATLPFPGAADLADMFEYYQRYLPYEKSVADCRAVYPGMSTFADWMERSKDKFE